MNYDLSKLTYPLTVKHRIQETSEAVSLVFSVPEEYKGKFFFAAGQFLTLFLEVDGETLPRSYSLCSSPAADNELKVTIKRVEGGKGSNYILDNVKEGDCIRSAPPAGHFYHAPEDAGPHHWILAAAGSGITPIFSILKTVLLTDPESSVDLLFANRSSDLIIYPDELKYWQERFPERLQITHVLSRPSADWEGYTGRCEGELLKKLLKKALLKKAGSYQSYLCGPDGFIKNIRDELLRQGLSEKQIHSESFTVTTAAPEKVSVGTGGGIYIGQDDAPPIQDKAEITVTLEGEVFSVFVPKGTPILEAIIDDGWNPPYSCLSGGCNDCGSKVIKGKVYQDDEGSLLDTDIADNRILTCQACPVTAEVSIDFDIVRN